MMRVAILLGAVRKGRQSHKATRFVARLLKEREIETDLIDLAKHPLPVFGTAEKTDSKTEKTIKTIGSRLDMADALIFATPEYQGSFSGALKNALDYYRPEFNRKPIGVVAISSGKFGGINAVTQLQHVILSLGAFPMPTRFLVPEVDLSFNDLNETGNKQIIARANKFIREFLWFASALYQKKMGERMADTLHG